MRRASGAGTAIGDVTEKVLMLYGCSACATSVGQLTVMNPLPQSIAAPLITLVFI
jgi:hypothetical protein